MKAPAAQSGERRTMPKAMMSGGLIVAMVATDAWIMVRRPGCTPFVLSKAEWARCSPVVAK